MKLFFYRLFLQETSMNKISHRKITGSRRVIGYWNYDITISPPSPLSLSKLSLQSESERLRCIDENGRNRVDISHRSLLE